MGLRAHFLMHIVAFDIEKRPVMLVRQRQRKASPQEHFKFCKLFTGGKISKILQSTAFRRLLSSTSPASQNLKLPSNFTENSRVVEISIENS